jgi:hypothetical protein
VDATWQRVEITKRLPSVQKGTEVRVVLRNPGAADVMYDDVRLVAHSATSSPGGDGRRNLPDESIADGANGC